MKDFSEWIAEMAGTIEDKSEVKQDICTSSAVSMDENGYVSTEVDFSKLEGILKEEYDSSNAAAYARYFESKLQLLSLVDFEFEVQLGEAYARYDEEENSNLIKG